MPRSKVRVAEWVPFPEVPQETRAFPGRAMQGAFPGGRTVPELSGGYCVGVRYPKYRREPPKNKGCD
jgi:hypothetical protein